MTMCGLSEGKKRESVLGLIPASWNCVKLEEVMTSSAYGPRFPGSLCNPDGNARTVRTTDFDRDGGINFSTIPAATLESNKVASHRLISGDFLLSRSGEYAGLTALFQDPGDGQTYIPGAFLIRYRFNERLLPEFLLTLCCSDFGERFVKPLATGSAQPNISGTAFANWAIPLPPIEEQRRIIEAVGQLRQLGNSFHEQFQRSAALLYKLVNRLFA
jgi:type I restriction enzyme S subunit